MKKKPIKIFLSLPMEGLTDAANDLPRLISRCAKTKKFNNRAIEVITYNTHALHYLGEENETVCQKLVRSSDVVLMLLDGHYGTLSKHEPSISVTHLEARTARAAGIKVLPALRLNTFHEYWVWAQNKDKSFASEIKYCHVKDTRVFLLIHEFINSYCTTYMNFTDRSFITQIIESSIAVADGSGYGTSDHLILV